MPGVDLVGVEILKNHLATTRGPGGGAKPPRPGVSKFDAAGGQDWYGLFQIQSTIYGEGTVHPQRQTWINFSKNRKST